MQYRHTHNRRGEGWVVGRFVRSRASARPWQGNTLTVRVNSKNRKTKDGDQTRCRPERFCSIRTRKSRSKHRVSQAPHLLLSNVYRLECHCPSIETRVLDPSYQTKRTRNSTYHTIPIPPPFTPLPPHCHRQGNSGLVRAKQNNEQLILCYPHI